MLDQATGIVVVAAIFLVAILASLGVALVALFRRGSDRRRCCER